MFSILIKTNKSQHRLLDVYVEAPLYHVPIGCSFSYFSKSVLATILAELYCVRLKLPSIGQN